VGYYTRKGGKSGVVPAGTPDFMLVAADRLVEMEARLNEPYFKEMVQIFPGAPNVYAFFRASVFAGVMGERTPEFLPGAVSTAPESDSSDEEMDTDDDDKDR
jgi:hypothetical protein